MLYSLDRFLNVRSAGGATFSPDGRYLAFLTNITGVVQLWQVPLSVEMPMAGVPAGTGVGLRRAAQAAGSWPTQLTFFNESVRGAAYNPVKHEILFSMDVGGNERTQLFRLTGTGGEGIHGFGEGWNTENLSNDPKAIHTFGGWSHDGKMIAFSATITKPERFDVYVQKLGERARLLREGPGGYYNAAGFSPDDKWLLVIRPESNFNHDLYVLNVATGDLKHLTPHEGEAQYESPKWAADGKSIYCTTTHGGRDKSALAQIDVATGKFTFLETSDHEVEGIEVSRNGRWLAWGLNVDGKTEIKLKDLKSGKMIPLPKLPLGLMAGLEFSPDEKSLAFTFDGPRNNPDVWLWNLESNQARQITFSSRAGIPFATFMEPELVKYPSFDGLQIPAWYYPPAFQPERPKDWLPPVIVYPHGGPESQTRPSFNALFQYFLQAGYGIFAPNVRGSSGYGTKYLNLDNTVKRMDSVKDMAAGVEWLKANKRADPKRIAVYGGSYGGFMVLSGVTNYPDLFAAGIDVVGIANFATFLENTGPYRRANREAEYGNLREHADFLKQISPIHHVDKIKCPMLVIHGANDPRVPIGEAEQIVAALQQRNVPVEYLRYEDEGHGLAKLKNRLDAYPKMVAFLNKHLK